MGDCADTLQSYFQNLEFYLCYRHASETPIVCRQIFVFKTELRPSS